MRITTHFTILTTPHSADLQLTDITIKEMSKERGKLTIGGNSQSTQESQKYAKDNYNLYASLKNLPPLENTTRDAFCTEDFFLSYCDWIVFDYGKKDGGFLALGTQLSLTI